MDIQKLLNERNIELSYLDKDYGFPELKKGTIITNSRGFTKNLLSDLGFAEFYPVSDASLDRVEEIKKNEHAGSIIGFGGGKAIDIAKKLAYDLDLNLISIPTAPSHDGLISKNCSLYNGIKRETIPTKYPSKIIIPLYLWKDSGNLKKSGICDLISNLTALQDLSLAEKNGEKFSEFYKQLSFESAEKVLGFGTDKELAEALIMSGIAMEETSKYCSGSEHEVERLLEAKINGGKYLHGQLAGTGTLISAKIYEIYSNELPDLRFESKNLFEEIKEKMKKVGVYEFAIEPLKDEKFNPEILGEISRIRPERYSLWNVIDSEKVEWKKIVGGILE
ncbi:MAG: iron-containing alcohol dehydrogenase [Candidatus Aenigmarchaeota archaeon]|nr:iron-containing alcohol dehydrogenase [Candidatus Aenigmarchaeota archaeon]